MQGAIILLLLTVILFVAAAAIPSFAGLFILAGLASGCITGLVALGLSTRK